MEKVGGLGTIASSVRMHGAQAATHPMIAGVKYLMLLEQLFVVNTVVIPSVGPLITVPAR